MWPIDIVRPDCDQRQFEAAPICADHHLCRCFARRVWVCRCQYARLAQVCRAHGYIAIHLVSRDVYKTVDATLSRAFQQHMCTVYVCVCELVRVAEAKIDVRLRSEMEDGVDFVLTKHALHIRRRCDVAILGSEVGLVVEGARIIERCAVIELVEGDYIVVFGVREDKMAGEPTGTVAVSTLLMMRTVYAFEMLSTYIKPAPPVTKMFFASGNGSKLVLPVSTGACCQSSL